VVLSCGVVSKTRGENVRGKQSTDRSRSVARTPLDNIFRENPAQKGNEMGFYLEVLLNESLSVPLSETKKNMGAVTARNLFKKDSCVLFYFFDFYPDPVPGLCLEI
jgi:hypothetical protein